MDHGQFGVVMRKAHFDGHINGETYSMGKVGKPASPKVGGKGQIKSMKAKLRPMKKAC
jgi:hypothetical protein